MESIGTLATLAAIYLAPTAIAILRSHKNAMAICALNLLTGWTAIGWIVAIVWAMTSNVKTDTTQSAKA